VQALSLETPEFDVCLICWMGTMIWGALRRQTVRVVDLFAIRAHVSPFFACLAELATQLDRTRSGGAAAGTIVHPLPASTAWIMRADCDARTSTAGTRPRATLLGALENISEATTVLAIERSFRRDSATSNVIALLASSVFRMSAILLPNRFDWLRAVAG
jgi:hypothetical protein